MTTYLLGVACGLYLAIGVWWLHGLYRLDRKPRRGVESQGKSAPHPCGAAGTEIGEQPNQASRQTGAGGPP